MNLFFLDSGKVSQRRANMKKGFTLMEILIVAVIIGILAVVGVAVYDKMIEDAKARVCENHTDTILGALEVYVVEHDQLPGSISQLTPQQIQKSYAKVMQTPDAWKIRLAYWLVNVNRGRFTFDTMPSAIAVTNDKLSETGLVKELDVFHCPANHSAEADGPSYTINLPANVTNAVEFDAYNNDDVAIVDDAAARHKANFLDNTMYKVGANKKNFVRVGSVNERHEKHHH
jgi:prepilin-type N-terminal cleavage/methylation domain-containing protein